MWILIITACVTTPIDTADQKPQDTRPSPGDLVFQQAEQFLSRKDFNRALERYSRYLSLYPEGKQADTAMFRIGYIYGQQGMHEESASFYQKMLNQFPESDLADDARLSMIDLLVMSQKPQEALVLAEQMLESNPDDRTRRKLWERLAKYHGQTGQMVHAAAYAYMIYKSSPEAEKDRWADRLVSHISRLNEEEINLLWDQMDDSLARSHLMYRYATVQVVRENYDEALEILIAFQETYPDHIYAQDAAQIIDTLEKRLGFIPQTVGCLLPLSGPYKVYGKRALNGIELALSLFHSQDVPSHIKLIVKDSASNNSVSVQGVQELVDAGAGVIIGPLTTAPSAAAEAQKLNIPMVTITQKADITEIGDYIFRHFITPQSQVKALVSYFTNSVGLRDYAIMYPNENYGNTFMTLFWDEVVRQGGRVVGVESYDPKQTDFATSIKKLVGTYHTVPEDLKRKSSVRIEENPYFQKRSASLNRLEDVLPDPVTRLTGLFFQDPDQDRIKGPALGRKQKQDIAAPNVDFDVLFIPDEPKTTGLILPQLAYYDIRDIYLAGTNLWHSQQLMTMTRDYAQNAVMAEGFFRKSPDKPVQQFVQTYTQIYGKEPGHIEAFAFDTAWLLFNLMAQTDIRHRHDLRDALLQRYEPSGVTGPTAFAENGEAVKSLSLLKIKGGRFVEIPRQ